jgi:hypothetical protein
MENRVDSGSATANEVAYCTGHTANGSRCKRRVIRPQQRCWQHARGIKEKWGALSEATRIGLKVLLAAATLLGPILWYVDWRQHRTEGWNPELQATVNDVLSQMEAMPQIPLKNDEREWFLNFTEKRLSKDPHSVAFLIDHGMALIRVAEARGGGDFRQALVDLKHAASVDHELGDPHFGLGVILYDLAIFDIAKRGRFEIHRKGHLGFNKKTGTPIAKTPEFSVSADKRNKLLLQGALDEFNRGLSSPQIWIESKGKAVVDEWNAVMGRKAENNNVLVYYTVSEIQHNVQTVRELSGYSSTTNNEEFFLKFLQTLARVDPQKALSLFEENPASVGLMMWYSDMKSDPSATKDSH